MTAKDLLHKILDYKYLWSSPDRINEKPSRLRIAQIDSLQDAFGLSKKYVNPLVQIKYWTGGQKEKLTRSKHLNKLSNLDYLLKGEFLHDRPVDNNKELSQISTKRIKELFKSLPDEWINKPVDFGWMFNDLFNFRLAIYKVAYPSEGMLEGFSVGLHYSKYLKSEIKKTINNNLGQIDDTLWMILDPEKKDIEINVLENEYNYKNNDLEKIDLEWRTDNY